MKGSYKRETNGQDMVPRSLKLDVMHCRVMLDDAL